MAEDMSAAMALLARSARLKLFAMLRQTVRPELLPERLGDHLRWMIGQEKAGAIFLSGPMAPHAGSMPLDGLTLIRAAGLAEAEAIARQDPFVAAGIVTFQMCEWTANEGSISVQLSLSDSTLVLR